MKKQIHYVILSTFFIGATIFGITVLYILKPEGINIFHFSTQPQHIKILIVGAITCLIIGMTSFLKSFHMEKV